MIVIVIRIYLVIHLIYDKNLEIIKNLEGDNLSLPVIVDNSIYYGIVDCPKKIGTRSDGSQGGIVPVYSFNTKTMTEKEEFILAHDAGWSC